MHRHHRAASNRTLYLKRALVVAITEALVAGKHLGDTKFDEATLYTAQAFGKSPIKAIMTALLCRVVSPAREAKAFTEAIWMQAETAEQALVATVIACRRGIVVSTIKQIVKEAHNLLKRAEGI